jgi:protein-tyrosine phosphatase
VRATDHAPRFLPLASTLNARDLGGLPLPSGGRTRPGVLIRADAPLQLTPDDHSNLNALSLSTVIDLREPNERERDPSAIKNSNGLAVHEIPVWQMMSDAGFEPTDPYDLSAFYRGLLDHAGAGFANAVAHLAHAPGAALFHCTAGKDRTGLLAALLLESVGVAREHVLEDFTLTEARIEPIRVRLSDDAERRGVARSDFARLLAATPDLLESALAHLDTAHGGANAYLQRHGVAASTLAALRGKLAGE